MEYRGRVTPAVFRARPNRFIALADVDGETAVCHVKNTGRCRELLVPGATVYLEENRSPARKTAWDLIAVKKGDLLINMDSQSPNRAAGEALPRLLPGLTLLKPETGWGNSRFDFYAETDRGEKWFIEVKGVTLEDRGTVLFPDAPTQRGTKHLRELCRCLEAGFRACMLFVIQMKGAAVFRPNEATDPAFAEALRQAAAQGVLVLAYDCAVSPDSMRLDAPVEVRLEKSI